jgi:hypothetical protein
MAPVHLAANERTLPPFEHRLHGRYLRPSRARIIVEADLHQWSVTAVSRLGRGPTVRSGYPFGLCRQLMEL